MLAYRRAGKVPSSWTAPGKVPWRSSEAPHPSSPAAAAAAKTLESDHADAVRGPGPLPEAERRRRDEVVKRCRPVRQGLLNVARDRPRGRAALAKRFVADMQARQVSRRRVRRRAFFFFLALCLVGKSQQRTASGAEWTGLSSFLLA